MLLFDKRSNRFDDPVTVKPIKLPKSGAKGVKFLARLSKEAKKAIEDVGLHVYEMRGYSEMCPITIEPRVLVDFCGTLILDKPLEFSDPMDKYLSIAANPIKTRRKKRYDDARMFLSEGTLNFKISDTCEMSFTEIIKK